MSEAAIVERSLHDLQARVEDARHILVGLQRGYPRQIQLENLRDPCYEVLHPLSIVLEQREGQYTATWYDADMFGYGDSEQEALEDLCESIVSLWEGLKREVAAKGLGDAPQRQWTFLQRVLREVA